MTIKMTYTLFFLSLTRIKFSLSLSFSHYFFYIYRVQDKKKFHFTKVVFSVPE